MIVKEKFSKNLKAARLFGRAALIVAAAAMLAGCFQPLYGERSATGREGIRDKLSSIEVAPINPQRGTREARLGIEVRNALLFNFTGGGSPGPQNYRLETRLVTSRTSVIVDITTARPDIENYGIDATYRLVDITTDKEVLNGFTSSRVSYDIPGQAQRFARERGFRDAEDRAAKVIAENITQRLASFLATGG